MQIPKIDISEIEEKEFSRTLLQDFSVLIINMVSDILLITELKKP